MKSIHFIAVLLLVATSLRAENPGKPLTVGDKAPAVVLRTDKNEAFDLRRAMEKSPAVLIFYRGGWCPYCTRHLSAVASIEKDLASAGVQLLAISADQPSKLREKPDHQALTYTLLSDSSMEAAKAFGIAFQVPEDLVEKYKSAFGIDLEAASGQTHHLLPHPAVFVVDKTGVIRFAHVNPDYKLRLDPGKILEAARDSVTR